MPNPAPGRVPAALVTEARAEHAESQSLPGKCRVCIRAWPCYVARLAEALEAAQQRIADLEHIHGIDIRAASQWLADLVLARADASVQRARKQQLEAAIEKHTESMLYDSECQRCPPCDGHLKRIREDALTLRAVLLAPQPASAPGREELTALRSLASAVAAFLPVSRLPDDDPRRMAAERGLEEAWMRSRDGGDGH